MAGSVHQPFLYEFDVSSSRLPEKPFDPKAVTRASWEAKPIKPKQDGPLLQFNRHPDTHEILAGGRKSYRTLSERTKTMIKVMRGVQLFFRVLELIGGIGVLVLAILISHMSTTTAWVLRISAGYVIFHTMYGVYHMSKPAGARSPASSAAYQVFSAFADLCVLPFYCYGALCVRNQSSDWSTLLANKDTYPYLKAALYYTLIVSGFLHLATLAVAFWLSVKFRQITMMPPDMNPLENNLTSRASQASGKPMMHQRNKSSVVTMSTIEPIELSKEQELSRPPSVPFMHTRTGSDGTSLYSSRDGCDSRINLPSRQYQISTHTTSARNSVANLKRSSQASSPTTMGRGSYQEIPLNDGGYAHSVYSHVSRMSGSTTRPTSSGRPGSSRPGSSRPGSRPDSRPKSVSAAGLGINNSSTTVVGSDNNNQGRFTEAWYASDSLKDRTQQRNQALNMLVMNATGKRSSYNPVRQNFDYPESDSDDDDDERVMPHDENRPYETYAYDSAPVYSQDSSHPNPLRSHPTSPESPPPPPPRAKTPYRPLSMPGRPQSTTPTVSSTSSYYSKNNNNNSNNNNNTRGQGSILGELHLNDRRVSGGSITGDLADGSYANSSFQYGAKASEGGRALTSGKGMSMASPTAATASPTSAAPPTAVSAFPQTRTPSKRWTWAPKLATPPKVLAHGKQAKQAKPRARDSSIQADSAFFSKPYGDLRAATPPVLVGQDGVDVEVGSGGRQVSSGNDYDLGTRQISSGDRYLYFGSGANSFGRRNVSGKVAEEGRAYSRYSVLNE